MAHFRFRYLAMICLLLFAASGMRSFGQASGTLEGYVFDSSNAAIPNAAVTIMSIKTGVTRKTTTDGSGHYIVTSLNPETYTITADAPGFSEKVLTGINLQVGTDEREDLILTVGQQSETVSIQATPDVVNTEQSQNGQLINNETVVQTPLANRQFYALALISPAAYQPAQNSTLGFRGGFNVAGALETTNQFTINGIYDNDMGTNQPSFRPSVEDIQEFKLLTGVYPAEYGRMSGGQLLIITKSGGNVVHGSAYEFIRNQVTDAKPFFTQKGGIQPAFKQNTFGITAGGPIIKNKLFVFGAYEGQDIRQQITALATVPTAQMMQGLFSIPTQLYNPQTGAPLAKNAQGFYDLSALPLWNSPSALIGRQIATLGYPAPTFATPANTLPGNNYNFSETRSETMNEGSARVDYTISDKDSLWGSFSMFTDPSFEPSNILCSAYVLPKFGCYTNQISTLANVTYTHIFSPNLLNEARIGFDRLQQPRVSEDNTAIGTQFPGLPGAFTQAGIKNNLGLPNTTVVGYSTVGGATNLPQNRWDNHYELYDAVTWTHGQHTFKFGTDLLFVRTTDLLILQGRGALTFNSALLGLDNGNTHFGSTNYALSDLLLGLPANTAANPTAPINHMNYQGYDLFAQDDWKVTPRLTLNLGLRWELDAPVYDTGYLMSKFDLATGQIVKASPTTFKRPYNYTYHDFAPRVGFAYQLFNRTTSVLKGGYGIYYTAPIIYNEFLSFGFQYPIRNPQTYTPGPYNSGLGISLTNPFPPGQSPGGATLSPLAVNQNYRTPYMTEWTLGLEQALSSTIGLEMTYFGSKGTRLPIEYNVNSAPPNTLSTAAAQATRPYPGYLNINYYDTASNSEYDSLQVALRKSYSQGVTFLMAYTWGKSIDGFSGIGSGSNSSGAVQNPHNLAAERGLSDFNVANRFTFSPVAELPFGKGKKYFNSGMASKIAGGWQISGIFTAQSGRPFTVFDASVNNSGSFTGADRPNIVPGQNPNAGPHTVQEWFNTAAFTLAPKGQFGNAGRNIVIGPSYVDLDAALAREFNITERLTGQFRVESFDALNHPNFFNPLTQGVQYGSGAAFGSITQANLPREMQFALRLLF